MPDTYRHDNTTANKLDGKRVGKIMLRQPELQVVACRLCTRIHESDKQ